MKQEALPAYLRCDLTMVRAKLLSAAFPLLQLDDGARHFVFGDPVPGEGRQFFDANEGSRVIFSAPGHGSGLVQSKLLTVATDRS